MIAGSLENLKKVVEKEARKSEVEAHNESIR
jgi:hypothetical protein